MKRYRLWGAILAINAIVMVSVVRWHDNVAMGFCALFAILMVIRVVMKLQRRRQAGSLLLELSRLRLLAFWPQWLTWFTIGMMALIGIWMLSPTNSARDLRGGTLVLLIAVSGLIDLPLMITPRIEIRRNGISYYGSLIKWEQIEAYAWERSDSSAREGDEGDILCLSGRFARQLLLGSRNWVVRWLIPVPALSKEAVERLHAQPLPIRVPALQKEAVERLLAQHVLRPTGEPDLEFSSCRSLMARRAQWR